MSKFTTSAGVLLSFGLFGSVALPAYAIPLTPSEMTERQNSIQELATGNTGGIPLTIERSEVVLEPEPEPAVAVYATSQNNTNMTPSYNGGGLLAAARSQIGWAQDCTALVENSLRMLGYNVGDLAPMDFARFGVQVSPADAQPGDIMMRGGHVAIYSGNGMAVHGGVPNYGGTVEFQYSSNPYEYAIIVRI